MPSNQEPDLATDEAIDGLLGLIEDGFGQALGDIWDFSTDLPGLVAREGPESPPVAAVKPILRAACRSYARGDGPQNLPGFDAAWGSICEPYLDSIGENPGDGTLGPPFDGGQCPAVYRIIFNATGASNACNPIEFGTNNVGGGVGPISYRTFHNTAISEAAGGLCPGFTYNEVIVKNASGEFSLVGQARGVKLNSFSVALESGAPDNCGNPPIVYDPPPIPPGLPPLAPFPIRFPGVGPVNVDVKFNPDGTINIGLPDLGVEVNVDDPFGLNDDEPGAPGGGPPPGDVGAPGTPVGVGSGGSEEGVAPDGSVLVGLRVQVVAVPNSRNRYTDEVLRGAYYVYMGVPGLLDHDPAGAMVRADQFIFAEQQNLTAWRIRANNGYELITTPYYRQVEG